VGEQTIQKRMYGQKEARRSVGTRNRAVASVHALEQRYPADHVPRDGHILDTLANLEEEVLKVSA
jgi:hypothetical protein